MGKFRVGDRVRVIDDSGGGKLGDIATVLSVGLHDYYVLDGLSNGSEGLFGQRLELVAEPKFKTGDRVRYTAKSTEYSEPKHIGHVGTVKKFYGQVTTVKWDGSQAWPDCPSNEVYSDNLELAVGASSSDDFTPTDDGWSFDPRKPRFKVEAGKYYRTRDGQRVGPMYRYSDGWSAENRGGDMWRNDGLRYYADSGGDTDLIAEWVDEPAAQPKYKPGDRLVVIKSPGVAKVGATAIVGRKGIYYEPILKQDVVDVVWDRNELHCGQSDGGYYLDTFSLVAPATSTARPAIVALLDNGEPRPATRPYVHADTASATTEAERLARTNPGKEFGVYELVATRKEAKQYDHEWQRLAAGGEKIAAIKELRSLTGLISLRAAKIAVEDFVEREAA